MTDKTKILVIKSHVSQLKLVEEFLMGVFKDCNLSRNNFKNVLLCISEAVLNSIEHGNKNDQNKEVSIGVNCVNSQISIYIKDEGEGFDMEKIADPTKHANLKKESGRGIFIIKSLADKIEYNHKENFIHFKMECNE